MADLNVANRTLFIADNLPILRGINSESIDLIATDPPFNKGVKAFEGIVTAGMDAEGKPVRYKDVWTWGDVQEGWVEKIREEHPALHSAIQLANVTAGDDMGAFLCWLAVRVLECRRILKPTGSIYIHIDHTAHAYVKAMMDAIFGWDNFRNEIVWAYKGMPSKAQRFQQKHDTILFYVKSRATRFNVQTTDPDSGSLKTFETGRRVGYNANHKRNMVTVWDWDKYEKAVTEGKIPSGMRATDFAGGRPPMRDWWDDIKILGGPKNKERTGYPTQKPIALYERIIKASSNEGDVVLDPFAGCATTCVAAENLGRNWVGIDINGEAEDVIFARLRQSVDVNMNWNEIVDVTSDPPERDDDGEAVAPELTLVSVQPRTPGLTARQLRERLVMADGMKCQGCGWVPHHADYLEADHRVPKAHGGRDDIRNRALLCSPCNSVKGKKLTLAELRERRLKDDRMMDPSWTAEWYQNLGRHGEPA